MILLPILIVISIIMLIISFIAKDRTLITINIINLILSALFIHFSGNILPELYNQSFIEGTSNLKGFEFKVYLGNLQLNLALLIVIVNIWLLTLWRQLFNKVDKKPTM